MLRTTNRYVNSVHAIWTTILATSTSCCANAYAADNALSLEKAKAYFVETKKLCEADHGTLWGTTLGGPIMIVNPVNREIIANQADAHSKLQKQANLFIGTLPAEINASNDSLEWEGKRWTMVLSSSLLKSDDDARKLMMHESFHRIQPRLGFSAHESRNDHLDTKQGRYLLQLEWKALGKALEATDDYERRQAITAALDFRFQRYRLFPKAEEHEVTLELNEGLAEYTGVKLFSDSNAEQFDAALDDLSKRVADPTFVRSFAYATGPAYGLLLDIYKPNWRQLIMKNKTPLHLILKSSIEYSEPTDLAQTTEELSKNYDGSTLWIAETEREANQNAIIDNYKTVLVLGRILKLPLKKRSLRFNPTTLIPMDNGDIVYPTLRVVSDWGILEVTAGALVNASYDEVSVKAPPNSPSLCSSASSSSANSSSARTIITESWKLILNPQYRIVPGNRSGDLTVVLSD